MVNAVPRFCAILVVIHDATDGLLSAHVPLEAVLRRFPGKGRHEEVH